jgi:hypothetical protein
MVPTTDSALPENDKDHLDRKLDHAIEETFPTSDPVSVSVTKGGAIDYDRQDAAGSAAQKGFAGQSTAENLLGQARETVGRAAGAASQAAHEAYDRSRRYARAARERYPEAERYYREGTQAVRRQASEYPLLTLLVGVGIGYALALMIHSRGSDQDEDVPDYARTGRGFAPYRAQPRA